MATKSMRSRAAQPIAALYAMRGPRRKPAAGNGLGAARLLAIVSALGAGLVTYVSVQSLGQLVLQQHQGATGAGAGAVTAGSGSWRDTWKLASELGAESLGLRHNPQRHSLRALDDVRGSGIRPDAQAASGAAATKAAQVGSQVDHVLDSSSGGSSSGGSASGSDSSGQKADRSSGAAATKAAQVGAGSIITGGGGTSGSGGTGSGSDKKDLGEFAGLPEACNVSPHTDFTFGDPVRWGTQNRVDDAGECCRQCREYKPKTDNDPSCNVWVWCGDSAGCKDHYKECWLKHLAHPDAVVPNQGPLVPWTAGFVGPKDDDNIPPEDPNEDRSFHTVITADGSATHWQSRVGYYHFLKVKKACMARGKCQMGGFTRVLHSGKADDLMDEIPTFVADPLPKEKHNNGGYVVINRPYAFVQWTSKAKIKEKYILMSEPDHIWLRPMPNLMKGRRPAAFPFFYIEPSKKEYLPITEKFTGKLTLKQAESIAPIGNAPTMMAFDDLGRVAPLWMNLSLAIFLDKEANKEWGWVQEMYAFTLACYNAGIERIDLHKKMMAQPPWDTELDPYYILHYTYGDDYTLEGVFTPGKVGAWHFDKRAWSGRPVDRHLKMPPEKTKNDLVRKLIDAINEATDSIPGWNNYIDTHVAKQLWDGKTFGKSTVAVAEMKDAR